MKNNIAPLLSTLLTLLFLVPPSFAKSKAKTPDPIPPYEKIDPDLLREGSRASLASAVDYFRKLAEKDEQGWIIPPKRHRTVIKHETITRRYREEQVEIPVYTYEYETVEVLVKKRSGQSTDTVETFQKEKRRKVVGREQTGTRMVTRKVHDPEGPIKVDHRRPVYGPGGPDQWTMNDLGSNALVLFALRRCGLSEDDPLVYRLANNLSNFLLYYGLPDETWDLAWITAAFTTLEGESYKRWNEKLASKLLDGQIHDGEARGLWGPVSINIPLMTEWVPKLQDAGTRLVAARAAAKGGAEAAVKKEGEVQLEYDRAQEVLRSIAISAMAGPGVESRVTLTSSIGESVIMPGLPHYIYNQTSADLESTALVLFVFQELKKQNALPEKVWRPKDADQSKEAPKAILARTAYALAKHQKSKGGWDQINLHQAVKHAGGKHPFPGVPSKGAFPDLPSRTSLLTYAQGFHGLANIGDIVGLGVLKRRYRSNLTRGLAAYRAAATKMVETFDEEKLVGGVLSPYECAFHMQEVANSFGLGKERPDLKAQIAYGLLQRRMKDGSWRHAYPYPYNEAYPSSLSSRIETLSPAAPERTPVYEAPHVGPLYQRLRAIEKKKARGRIEYDTVVPTAYSMLFLSEEVRPPVVGQMMWSESTNPSGMLSLILKVMQQNHGAVFQRRHVSRPITMDVIANLPGVFIRGTGNFDPSDSEKAALSAYLKSGGLLVMELPADGQGLTFFNQARKGLPELLPGSKFEEIGQNTDFLGEMAGKGSVQALVNSKGQLSVVMLPVASSGGRAGLAGPMAARIAYNSLTQKIAPEILEEDYAIAVEDVTTVDDILAGLFAGVPEPASEPVKPPVSEPVAPKPEEPKAPAIDETF